MQYISVYDDMDKIYPVRMGRYFLDETVFERRIFQCDEKRYRLCEDEGGKIAKKQLIWFVEAIGIFFGKIINKPCRNYRYDKSENTLFFCESMISQKAAKEEISHISIEEVEIEIIEKWNFKLKITIDSWVDDGRDDPNDNIDFYKKDPIFGIKKFFEKWNSKIKANYGINIPEVKFDFLLKNFSYK